ncbi:MAG: hypothetical protein COB15_11375 [Flavobacteriales bacterium]|nr:MAG: hypothetical protein COB15_11375 [Flavobacteriales bacterium]
MNVLKLIFAVLLSVSLFCNGLFAQQASLKSEIYDFDIGDIFHFVSESLTTSFQTNRTRTDFEVIDKYYSITGDTVYYVRDVSFGSKPASNSLWTYSTYIDTAQYSNLADTIIPYVSNSGLNVSVISDTNFCHGRIKNRLTFHPIEYTESWTYVVGCGYVSHSYSSSQSQTSAYSFHLVYYKKGIEEWGIQNPTSIDENELNKLRLEVFPNPTSDYLSFNSQEFINANVTITSIEGKNVLNMKIVNDNTTIDLSNLTKGVYVLNIYNASQSINKKIVKD